MKCSDMRTFLSEVAEQTPIQNPIPQPNLDYLASNGYISIVLKADYDKLAAEVADLTRLNEKLQSEHLEEQALEAQLSKDEHQLTKDEHRVHGILFHFESKERKVAEAAKVEQERETTRKEEETVREEEEEIAEEQPKLHEFIEKKSALDRLMQCGDVYVALTGLGVTMLTELNVKNYRVAEMEFGDYVNESKQTTSELEAIAQKAKEFESALHLRFPPPAPHYDTYSSDGSSDSW